MIEYATSVKNGSIEDEAHFLLACKEYDSLRESFLSNLDIENMNHQEKFIFIMSYNHGDTEIIQHVLDFVNEAFKIRFPT